MATITEKASRMHSPAHPGEILREMYLKPLNITVTQTAKALGVSRKHVSAIVNGRSPVTPDMALRLASALPRARAVGEPVGAVRPVDGEPAGAAEGKIFGNKEGDLNGIAAKCEPL